MISNDFARTDRGKKGIKIINNLDLSGGWGIAVFWKRSSSDSRELKRET